MVLLCTPCLVFSDDQDNEADLNTLYQTGMEALENSDYHTAYKHFTRILVEYPEDEGALYHAGIAAERLDNNREAIDLFKKLIAVNEKDWQVIERLIFLHNDIGDITGRDHYRSMLVTLWSSKSIVELSERPIYLIDKFEMDDSVIYVFNSFELVGERPIRYKFNIYDSKTPAPEDGPAYVISLGSYNTTTEFSRQSGKIGPTDRLFHLDGYAVDGSHRTYGFYLNEPTYDKVRAHVVDILSGKVKELSSFQPNADDSGTITLPSQK
jgi:tetratricopeptide (TPR) repeat protein